LAQADDALHRIHEQLELIAVLGDEVSGGVVGGDGDRQHDLLRAVVDADLRVDIEALPSRAYHWCSRSMVGATIDRRAVGRGGWPALPRRSLPAPVGSTMLPRRPAAAQASMRLDLVVVWLAAVIEGGVEMRPTRDRVTDPGQGQVGVMVSLTAPFPFDPLERETGRIGFRQVGDNERTTLKV
jgi:hypothetical protein